MKIALLFNDTNWFFNLRKELLNILVETGYEVLCILPENDDSTLLLDISCKCVETKIDRRGTNPIKDFGLFHSYISILKKEKPNIVLTYTIKPNVYGGLACRILGIPYIANITGLGTAVMNKSLLQGLTYFLYRQGLLKASCVFFQNSTNEKILVEHEIALGKRRIIPGSGVNLTEHCFEKYPKDDGKIKFLYIGRAMKDKGIDELIDSMTKIKKKYSNVYLDLVGNFDDDIYKAQFEKLEEQGILTHLGFSNDIHSLTKESHAIIMPSYHEGMSNALLEGCACGRPIIASDVAGCREIFDDGISGFSCIPKNSDSLYNAMEKFILLPYKEKSEMGIRAREKVEKYFDRKIVVAAYMQEIETTLKGE